MVVRNRLPAIDGNISQHQKISYLLPWVQWFHVYAFISGVTLGYLAILIIDFYLVIRNGKARNIHFEKKIGSTKLSLLLFYIIVALLVAALCDVPLRPVSILNRIFKLVCLYALIFECDNNLVDWNCYKKSLKILTYFACGVLLWQFAMHAVTGGYYNLKIPFLRYTNDSTAARVTGFSTESRFRSIFTEPAHFVYFVFQYLAIAMFSSDDIKSRDVISAIFVSLCVILSVSSTGMILLVVVWLTFLMFLLGRGSITKRNFAIAVFVVLCMAAAMMMVWENEQLRFALFRLTGNYEHSDIVWKRINANANDVTAMKGIFAWIGYGMGNVDSKFMNSFIYSLLNVGYIGTALIIAWLTEHFIRTGFCGKIAIILLVLLAAIDMVLYTPTVLAYMVIVQHFEYDTRLEESNT